MKERGSISTKAMNILLQQRINPDDPWETSVISKKDYVIREGDKILITKNMYDAQIYGGDDSESICPVFNGDIGYVHSITKDYAVINFPMYGMIKIDRDNWSGIELGYAMTCHKLQGSEAPYILIGLDSSAYALLTKEWLYTAITRAKKHCIICAETKALGIACNTSNVMKKQTLLSRLIQSKFGEGCITME